MLRQAQREDASPQRTVLRAEIVKMLTLLREVKGGDVPQKFAALLKAIDDNREQIQKGIIAWIHLIEVLVQEAERGKLVLGLCNGAQVLAEVGVIGPIAIARNLPSGHFQCRIGDVELVASAQRCAFTAGMTEGTTMKMAMAHGEGRFTGSPAYFDQLEKDKRITFRFVGGAPNGAMHDAAGICNDAGNVLAIMPHPERVGWNFNLAFEDPSLRDRDPNAPSHSHSIFAHMAKALR